MKTNDKIETKNGYTGVIMNVFFSGKVAVILDNCTYSDEHWYDVIPKSDITVIKDTSEKLDVAQKVETLEEKKSRLEEYWFEQENWRWLSDDVNYSEYPTYAKYREKQKSIAILNTVIDKLNEELGEPFENYYYLVYNFLERKFGKSNASSVIIEINQINPVGQKTKEFILENYSSDLKTVFGIE